MLKKQWFRNRNEDSAYLCATIHTKQRNLICFPSSYNAYAIAVLKVNLSIPGIISTNVNGFSMFKYAAFMYEILPCIISPLNIFSKTTVDTFSVHFPRLNETPTTLLKYKW